MQQLLDVAVMVTRPNPAGAELCALIEEQGGRAIHFPTIAFTAADQTKLQQAIQALGEQDWLIFISPQAVYASVPAIRRTWPQFPPGVKFAAVGGGTANALLAAGYQASVYPSDEWNSEALLNLPAFNDIKGKKIAIIRGEGGRELLAKTLTDRGAQVLHVIAYQRIVPPIDVNVYLQLLKQHKIDVIVCGSFESVRNAKLMLGDEGWPYLKTLPLLVMSERVKTLAQDLGFQTIWVARNPSHASIMEMLIQKKDSLCQTKLTK